MIHLTNMNTPTPITDFFDYKNTHNEEGLLSIFAPDATVFDTGEDKELHGIDEIKEWIQKSISGLNLHTEIVNIRNEADTWIIKTIVSGDFKASPAEFEYFIELKKDKISLLRTEFRGSVKK